MKRNQEKASESNKKAKQATQDTFLVGKWMPKDHEHLHNWMTKLRERADEKDRKLLPVIKDFKHLIENDSELFMLFKLMFDEVPRKFKQNLAHHHQVRSYQYMLKLLNHIMTEAPHYDETGIVGCPITAIFVYSMGTTAGFAAFLSPKVNRQLKIVLNEWAAFLGSPDSRYVLTTKANGWFSESGLKHMLGDDPRKFEEIFVCDPEAEYHGYTSWDNFFTRQFVDGLRPVAEPTNDNVIANACESSPYKIARNVNKCDEFWIKGQPYSLQHMLAGDEYVDTFVGGTVYQAFLSALSYHRWHSPVSGTIVKSYVVDGTYYSEALSQGWSDSSNDGASGNDVTRAQGYITAVATRALIFIQADNAEIGLMCFMAVGMVEVSTCDIRVYEGQHVNKGDQLGMFHFGGSSYCMIFQPNVELEFDLHGVPEGLEDMRNVKINSCIARVIPKVPAKGSSA